MIAAAGSPPASMLIVTCANRKSQPIPPELQLGDVGGRNSGERARRWMARLAQASIAPQIPAVDLYAGEHWSVARKFPELHRPGETVHLWACSAGYGLIPADAPLMPYHATLTPGQADSVPGDSAAWWAKLGNGPAGPGPPANDPGTRGRKPDRGVHVRALQELSRPPAGLISLLHALASAI